MNILVINGPNINMLGVREKEIYGETTYKQLCEKIAMWAQSLNIKVDIYQSNCEGEIVTQIQLARGKYDGIIINAGAYSHTSIAILDALKCAQLPVAEVHISDISKRESFRRFSYVSLCAEKSFIGLGTEGYKKALEYFSQKGDKVKRN